MYIKKEIKVGNRRMKNVRLEHKRELSKAQRVRNTSREVCEGIGWEEREGRIIGNGS